MKTVDIKTFCDQLQGSMKSELETVGLENQDFISRTSKCLAVVSSAINQLKEFVYSYNFLNTEEEITFFKEVKPVFISQYYYYDRVFSIKIGEPFNGLHSLTSYYQLELEKLQEFAKANEAFYRYCLSGSTHLDEKYFTRGDNVLTDPVVDSKFSTGYDNTLARILAYHMVKEHLTNLISKMDTDSPERVSSIKWTGTKTALIELIYALQSVDAINNGKADIKQIADSFETLFNVSLGNYYRQFQELRLRKSGKTNFLDDLKEKLVQRLDDFA